jgi:hypothetical protein
VALVASEVRCRLFLAEYAAGQTEPTKPEGSKSTAGCVDCDV